MNATPVLSNGTFDLISQSGPMAKLVLIILLAASVISWTIIITKYRAIKNATAENVKFLNLFWNGKSIDDIFSSSDKFAHSPIAKVFKNGVKELKKFSGTANVDNVGRALLRASSSEVAQLERHVGWLATTASATPFIGLFGTVWGIMNSFQGIGASGSANLAVVAPGISEALITTATGIAAAVPAVIAYNYLLGQIKRQALDMDGFTQDFLNIIQRSVLTEDGSRKGQS